MTDQPNNTLYLSIDLDPETGDLRELAVDLYGAVPMSSDQRKVLSHTYSNCLCCICWHQGMELRQVRAFLLKTLDRLNEQIDASPSAAVNSFSSTPL